jgi:Skp family chaperone for outer membrane proteins
MKHSHKLFTVLAGLSLVVGSLNLQAAFAQTAASSKGLVVGVVDQEKVVTSYGKAQKAAEDLQKSEEKIHKFIEDSNKKYEEAKAAKKPPAELEGLQRRLQTEIDSEVKSLQGKAQALETQLQKDIQTAIKTEATNRKVDIVLMKQAVLSGGIDLTDGVVKKLAEITSTEAKPKAVTK